MKTLSVAIVIASALIAVGLHSLGTGIASSKTDKQIEIDHRIQFSTDDPMPGEIDVNLGIKGQGSPALHIRVDQ